MSETALSYALMILADADITPTQDNLLKLTKAANVTVEPIWADVFARASAGKDLKEVLFAVGASGPAAAAAPAAGAAPDAAPAEAAAPAEESESDGDMGMGLFD